MASALSPNNTKAAFIREHVVGFLQDLIFKDRRALALLTSEPLGGGQVDLMGEYFRFQVEVDSQEASWLNWAHQWGKVRTTQSDIARYGRDTFGMIVVPCSISFFQKVFGSSGNSGNKQAVLESYLRRELQNSRKSLNDKINRQLLLTTEDYVVATLKASPWKFYPDGDDLAILPNTLDNVITDGASTGEAVTGGNANVEQVNTHGISRTTDTAFKSYIAPPATKDQLNVPLLNELNVQTSWGEDSVDDPKVHLMHPLAFQYILDIKSAKTQLEPTAQQIGASRFMGIKHGASILTFDHAMRTNTAVWAGTTRYPHYCLQASAIHLAKNPDAWLNMRDFVQPEDQLAETALFLAAYNIYCDKPPICGKAWYRLPA